MLRDDTARITPKPVSRAQAAEAITPGAGTVIGKPMIDVYGIAVKVKAFVVELVIERHPI
jgi:hypothetical protein